MFSIKCMRYSINRIQRKDYKTRYYEISQIFFACSGDKIYIENNGYDVLALDY